jgi:thiol-disulfide isomerase/thioredoxin
VGSQGPDASLEDLDGNPVLLSDWMEEGKPTLIEFWASWCGLCKALQPQLDRIQAEWGGQVNLLAVAVPVSQTRRRVKKHAQEHDSGYPYLWDAEGEAVRAYEVPGTSVVVILDGTREVVYTGSGRSQDLAARIQEVLGIQIGSQGSGLPVDPGTLPDPPGFQRRRQYPNSVRKG